MHGAAQPATLTCPKCSGDMRIQRFPENDAYRAVDGDLATAWTSEEYNSREDFQGIKPGVGLVLTPVSYPHLTLPTIYSV